MTTPNLQAVELVTNQANPENTYNSNLLILDALVMANIIDSTLTIPPGSPNNGDRYIPATTATGAWVGEENNIAYYYNGWYFFTPQPGWAIYDETDDLYKIWSGTAWIAPQMDPEVIDTAFRVLKSTDATSKMAFDMSKIQTATTVNFIMPNGDVEFAKTKLDATAAPTINDDITLFYEPGSIWIDQTNNKGYLCVDNTDGAAVWREMAAATGTGDVTGPVSGTDNAIVRMDGTGGKTIQNSGVLVDDNNALYGHFAKVVEKTANYTLTGSDSGQVITVNSASAVTITLPQTSTESISQGFQVAIIRRGAGTVTVAIEGSDTIESVTSYVSIANQYGSASVVKIVAGSPNTWSLIGDLA